MADIAIHGENTIIYAATGAGKTRVAFYVVKKHLESNPKGKDSLINSRADIKYPEATVLICFMHKSHYSVFNFIKIKSWLQMESLKFVNIH